KAIHRANGRELARHRGGGELAVHAREKAAQMERLCRAERHPDLVQVGDELPQIPLVGLDGPRRVATLRPQMDEERAEPLFVLLRAHLPCMMRPSVGLGKAAAVDQGETTAVSNSGMSAR